MNILIDIGHPAHVHFFKNAIPTWRSHGHTVKITTREIPAALQLMEHLKLPYVIVSKKRTGLVGLALELIEHTCRIYPLLKKWKIDACVSIGGTYMVFAGALARCRRIVFTDTETAITANRITFPFANTIVTPEAYPHNLGPRQVRYNGFHELAYVHPDYFSPNPETLKKYGLSETEYFSIVRLCSWEAFHDLSARAASTHKIKESIEKLKERGKVIIVPEGRMPEEFAGMSTDIQPEDFHDLLYYAGCCITEGATTAAEAAILGTPSLYINPSHPRITQTYAKYGSMHMAHPGEALEHHITSIMKPGTKESAQSVAKNITEEHINVVEFLTKTVEKPISNT